MINGWIGHALTDSGKRLITVLILGIFFTIVGIYGLFHLYDLQTNYTSAEAIVIESLNQGENIYGIEVRFTTQNHELIETKLKFNSSNPLTPGETIPILYNINNPNVAQKDSSSPLLVLFFLALGILFDLWATHLFKTMDEQ
ncbi:MAG: hypothetical protein HON47_03225 [Candidatus Diapherotrites archaeon]|jgi:hypothetical protein|uniref:DUF3592 domain-containing protein n=1 Tax=Candidatus Iainarchaeum sp. TaxID=3101447 RepID=A0A8T5GFR0_9ARCH|nr:hypothetical protein [Candidatus Diapherotrites archaeon]